MEQVDITIVGAGVIGLSIAAQMAEDNRTVFVIEKHDSFGRETSSRNSEVIHSGIYYRPGSLKAKTCIQGNRKIIYLIKKQGNSLLQHKIQKFVSWKAFLRTVWKMGCLG